MKWLTIFLVLASSSILSARSLLHQGTFGIGTNASYYYIQNESQSAVASFKLLPGLDYFLFNNFSFGLSASYANKTNSEDDSHWRFGPNVRYYTTLFFHVRPFAGASYMASASNEYASGEAGVLFFLTKSLSLETLVQYTNNIGNSSVQQLGFSGGIRLFL